MVEVISFPSNKTIIKILFQTTSFLWVENEERKIEGIQQQTKLE